MEDLVLLVDRLSRLTSHNPNFLMVMKNSVIRVQKIRRTNKTDFEFEIYKTVDFWILFVVTVH